uniref:ATP-binding cassette transporter subfamily G-like protein 4 n=1 Tax=Brachionus rotundiformis TaxID=96890 RepID=A0A7H9SNT3_9BILA|nr:ATP-binding cassette transporter subfamily G-like protein 4 [Brachionus rotundiformis]
MIKPEPDMLPRPISNGSISVNLESSNCLTLTWEDLNVFVPEAEKSLFKKKPLNSEKLHIVQNVHGVARPGQVLAIMGASGAGKTTLLNVLTLRNNGNLVVQGSVKINGKTIDDQKQLSAVSGYVQQNDIFIGTLKVVEHLKFQAMLRMDRHTSYEEKMKRVEQVMNDLNLKKCENTLIGVAQLGIKGISGGEMRRLAFASEIITDPGILFCDEPTSGLDSFMAMSIVESMKNLAKQGKTIVCTIHQPSSEIFELFDRLFLMAEGRAAFLGDLADAKDFFASQGFSLPINYNPADYYIKTLAIMPSEKQESKERVKRICDGYNSSKFCQEVMENVKKINGEQNLKSASFQSKMNSAYKTSWFNQLKWLIWRSFLSTSRNPMETRILAIQTLFIALIFGLIYLQIEDNQEGVQNINGVLFLLITNASFSNMFGVLNSFPAELPIFYRDHQNSMYRTINYYLSKFIIELPKYIIFPAIFVAIVYWMAGLNNDGLKFALCVLTIILVANSAVSFGSFISAAAPSVNAALALSAPLLVPLMIFSGFFLNNSTVPSYFIWIKYLSWLNYANEILIVNQWDGVTNIYCPANSTRCFRNGDDVINALGMKKDNFALDFILLGCIILVFRTLACSILTLKARLKK